MKKRIFKILLLWQLILKALRFFSNLIERHWRLLLGCFLFFKASKVKIDWDSEEPTWRSWLMAVLLIWGTVLLINWIIGLWKRNKSSI